MRPYTVRDIEASDIISPDDFNLSNQQIAAAYNHNVDAHNIPTSSLTADKFAGRELDSRSRGSLGVWAHYDSDFTTGSDYTDPLYFTDLITADVTPGWVKLSDFLPSTAITIDTEEGLLRCDSIVDFERRYGYNGVLYTAVEGTDHWTQFGIFLDGQLVHVTQKVYPRRYTLFEPWSTLILEGEHTIDIRYRFNSTLLDPLNSEADQTIFIYTLGHFTQNRIR